MENLRKAGVQAQNIPLYSDLYAVFNYEPFQRISKYMTNPETAPYMKMYFELYQYVEREYQRFSPIERLGIVDAIMSDPESRRALLSHFTSQEKALLNSNDHLLRIKPA